MGNYLVSIAGEVLLLHFLNGLHLQILPFLVIHAHVGKIINNNNNNNNNNNSPAEISALRVCSFTFPWKLYCHRLVTGNM